jgi:hypothetical protein
MPFAVLARRVLLIVATAVAACTSPVQGDTWWALRAGRDIWRRHAVSLTDHYSYTASGHRWPDHEWLWQVALYAVHQAGGLALVNLVVGVIGGATLAIATAAGPVRRTDLVLLALAVPALLGGWAVRPQVVSMLLFATVLWLLRTRRWWWCVPLMLLWANLHGGVVFGGLALASACVAAAACRRRFLRSLLPVTALGAIATLATPLGTGLWHYVLTAGSRPFEDRITEWEPAYSHLDFFVVTFWLWVAGTTAVVAVRWRRLASWEAAVSLAATVATLPLAIDATRNMVMFALAALPLLIQLLRPATPASRPTSDAAWDLPARAGEGVMAAVGALAALATALVFVTQPAALGWRPMSSRIAAAIESCPGHVYTSYDSGAYLIWFTPGVEVFVDNRQDPYSEQILDLSVLAADSPYRDTFTRYDVRCAALLTSDLSTLTTLRRDGWSTATGDAQWVVLTAPGAALGHALASGS